MNINQTFRTIGGKFISLIFLFAIFCIAAAQSFAAATLSPKLQNQLVGIADNVSVGTVIVAFHTENGLQQSHLSLLQSLGVVDGETFPTLGMAAFTANAGQIRALMNNSAVRSIWTNDRLQQNMHQARVVAGVDKTHADRGFQTFNGGMPVTGNGDFSVLVIDSGIDATHSDLQYGTKVIANSQRVRSRGSSGLTPSINVNGIPGRDLSPNGAQCRTRP